MFQISSSPPSRLTLMGLDDHKIIGYRPKLNAEIGSVLSTIVVCQAMYWAQHSGNPFYKFIEPCKHASYRKGDSWVEELGFTRHEFLFAIKRVAQKLSKKSVVIDRDAFIWYWTDISRVTWYQVNWDRVNDAFDAIYPVNPESGFTKIQKVDLGNSGIPQYVNPESGFTYNEQRLTSQSTQKASSSDVVKPGLNSTGKDDDDDLFRDLLDLGLSPTLAKEVLQSNPRILVEHKLKDMVVALNTGKVGNMTGYAMKVFSGVLYSAKQVEEIMKRAEKPKAGPRKPDTMDVIDTMDEIAVPEMSIEMRGAWEKHISINKVLWRIYQERGTESPLIRVSMKDFLGRR